MHLTFVDFRDILEDGCGVRLSEAKALILSKCLAVVFGLVGFGLVFVVKSIDGVLEVGWNQHTSPQTGEGLIFKCLN